MAANRFKVSVQRENVLELGVTAIQLHDDTKTLSYSFKC